MMTQKDEGHGEAINKLKEHEEALALKDQDHAETQKMLKEHQDLLAK